MSVTFAPHNARYAAIRPASDKQLAFLRRLQDERLVTDEQKLAIGIETQQPEGPSSVGVSMLIDELLEQPAKITRVSGPSQKKNLPDVPAGRYAVPGKDGKLRFIRVDRPDEGPWNGWTFVSVQAGDEFHRLKGDQPAKALQLVVDAGPEAASRRYGHEIGSCGVCGRTLTNEDSRKAGIGPICLSNMGW